MPNIDVIIAAAILASTCSFALLCGGSAERVVAILLAASMPLGFALALLPGGLRQIAELSGDAIIAFVVLGLALRFTSVWLGAALLLYGAQFAFHAIYFVISRPPDKLHVIASDLILLGITISLLTGTIGALRSRARLRTGAAAVRP